jgi:ectoine hydroxylase-related dioxygenase (phytanoyl-CoA dioxygenase family)
VGTDAAGHLGHPQEARPTLRSPAAQAAFAADGFAVIDLFDAASVRSLTETVWDLYTGPRSGFHTSAESLDHGYRARLHEALVPVFEPVNSELFDDHVPIMTAFLVKWPGADGAMAIHQDWSFVDETQYRSLSIWCPLVDVDAHNGALAVLPGSHRQLRHFRCSPGLPASYPDPARELSPSDLVTVEMSAGQGLLTDHAILHCSPPDLHDEPRVAIAISLAPREAELYHHYRRSDEQVERFRISDPAWFRTFNFGERPAGVESDGVVPFVAEPLSSEELLARCRGTGASAPPQLRSRTTLLEEPLQRTFEEDGYAVVDLLEADEIAQLRAGYAVLDHQYDVPDAFAAGFHATIYDPRHDYRADVLEQIDTVIGSALDRVLLDHQILFANFTVKLPGSDMVPHHLDWSFVDERVFTSATVWCALEDTDEQNGTLGMVRGSHRNVDFVRAVNHRDHERCAALAADTGDHTLVPLRAGQAIIMDNRTVHFSPPNSTDQIRMAAACVVAPAEAPLYHYWLDPDDGLVQIEVEREFYLSYTIGSDPRDAHGARAADLLPSVAFG